MPTTRRIAATVEDLAKDAWSVADEMHSARSVQSRMLPRCAPRFDGLECAGLCLPERGVGGDFFDFVEARPGRPCILIGDVSGKGVPAALMMAALQASLRSHSALASTDLARRLESVNRFFVECTAPAQYASLFIGEYEETSKILRYANCGHVRPLVLHGSLQVTQLETTAMPLGMFPEWTCRTVETSLAEGDLLLLVSDGATEATSPAGEPFGYERLAGALRLHRELRTATIVRAIADEVRAFCGGAPRDDLTVVAARVRAPRGGSGPRRAAERARDGGSH